MKTPRSSLLRQLRGQALLMVLGLTTILSLSFFAVSHFAPQLFVQSEKSASLMAYRLVLNSVVDYTLFGIRQDWCFTNTWQQDFSSSCGLSHPYYSSRLLLSNDAINTIYAQVPLPAGLPARTDIRLRQFQDVTLPIQFDASGNLGGSLGSSHPLYKIFSNLPRDSNLSSVTIHVERIDNIVRPSRGKEVYLKIRSSIRAGGRFFGRDFFVESVVGFFPRELDTMALIVANDFDLAATSETPNAGNRNFVVATQPSMPSSGGLVFDSPVFVNGNVRLPVHTASPTPAAVAPVTFGDKVILGSGIVTRGGNPYRPETAGGVSSRFYSQESNFGGFLGGIERDGSRDCGLDIVSNNPDPAAQTQCAAAFGLAGTATMSLMQQCIANRDAVTDFSKTIQSQLVVKKDSSSSPSAAKNLSLRFALSNGNRFSEQVAIPASGLPGVPTRIFNAASAPNGIGLLGASVTNSGAPGALIQVDLNLGASMRVKANISAGGAIALNPNVDALLPVPVNDPANPDDDALIAALTAIKSDLQANPPSFSLSLSQPSKVGSDPNTPRLQANQIKLDLQSPDPDRLALLINAVESLAAGTLPSASATTGSIQIGVEAFDVAARGINVDESVNSARTLGVPALGGAPAVPATRDLNYRQSGTLSLQLSGGNLNLPAAFNGVANPYLLADSTPGLPAPVNSPDDAINYGEIDFLCRQPLPSATPSAFASASWNQSFASGARSQWKFANVNPLVPIPEAWNSGRMSGPSADIVILNSCAGANPPAVPCTFLNYSIRSNCVIPASANFVAGFFTCDRLTIESRSTPLRIIGTVIASQSHIHPSAIQAGIRWSSIFNPTAVYELRRKGILGRTSVAVINGANGVPAASAPQSGNCDMPTEPLWHPYPSMQMMANAFRCNPVSLRTANPFTWTMVDPDCGMMGASAVAPSCKSRLRRFLTPEASRESNL